MNAAYTVKRLADVGRGLWLHRRLEQHERWARSQILELQQQRLAALVRHAVAKSPFYRHHFGRRGGAVALEDLPVLQRTTMMEQFDRIVTDPRLTLVDVERHVDGLSGDDYYLGKYRVVVTAGTTGVRGLFVYNRRAWSTVIASILRFASMMGVSPRLPRRLRFATIGAPSPLHMTNRVALSADVGLYGLYASRRPGLSMIWSPPERVPARHPPGLPLDRGASGDRAAGGASADPPSHRHHEQ